MNWKGLLKPTKLTWTIFVTVISVLIINVVLLNKFNFGIEALVMIPIYLPLSIFGDLGLNVTSGSGWFPLPNLLGYVLIIMFNIIVILATSLVLTIIVNRIKNKFFSEK